MSTLAAEEHLAGLRRRNAINAKEVFGPEAAETAVETVENPSARLLRLRARFDAGFRVANGLKQHSHDRGQTKRPRASLNQAAEPPASQKTNGSEGLISDVVAADLESMPVVGPARPEPTEATALTVSNKGQQSGALITAPAPSQSFTTRALMSSHAAGRAVALARDRPEWHPPWRLFRVISGHVGWVRSVAVDPSNQWFATGSADKTIKIWDLASGELKLTLTGHIGAVRGLVISDRHPYMFSVGDDKQVKCWDLEVNKVVRHYHGHLSGVYSAAIHPALDVLATGGRDATVRVWDIRQRAQIYSLGGHGDTVNSIAMQDTDPQVISGSADATVRLWDLAAGRSMSTLTNHKKGIRAVALHPREFTFASASSDNIKNWKLPNGQFMRNFSNHKGIINSLSINEDNVMVSGGDDGSLCFWDYKSAHLFCRLQTKVQPGSLESEAGIFASSFDRTGTRLITCETDKTIKMWKEVENATPESHPLDWVPDLNPKRY